MFTIQIRGWDIRHQHNFNLKINNNHASNPDMLFDASNVRKYQKVIQNGLQRETQNPSKIIKNPPWDLPRSLSTHL